MRITETHMNALKKSFSRCQKMLTAIGDETRQQLLMIMMTLPCSGSRVIEIAEKTHLSRPAVSHHMQILKDAGIVESRKEGKNIYYYLAPDGGQMDELLHLVEAVKELMQWAPDRSKED